MADLSGENQAGSTQQQTTGVQQGAGQPAADQASDQAQRAANPAAQTSQVSDLSAAAMPPTGAQPLTQAPAVSGPTPTSPLPTVPEATVNTAVATATPVMTSGEKTAEQYIEEAEKNYIVPSLIRFQYPDLIKLIYETESMDQEEREYWLQIMPIMSEEQVKKFRDILVNEKTQLDRLDQEYKTKTGKAPVTPINEEEMKEKMQQIQQKEQASQEAEKSEEAKLLEQLEGLGGDSGA